MELIDKAATTMIKDPNDYIGSVFIWDEGKVKEIMQDIVNFTRQSDNNVYGKRWK